jgi:glycosyltransferase involved in cell wall biosynthesis
MAGWLDTLVEVFQRYPDVGVVGSRLLFPDGRLQEAGGIVWNDASAWNFGRLDDPQKPEYNYLKEADYVSGAALMVRRDLFEQLGYFDERYAPAYYEDTDLCFAVREAGYRVLLQPRSNVVHIEGVSHGTDTESGVKQHQVDNQRKFLEKWRPVLQRDHFANGEQVFLARDRSRHRRTVLVIDHYVPHFDRDAGSRSTWHYLNLFVEQGFNVKFLGDNFFRHEPYTTRMEDLGIEVLLGNEYAQKWREWLVDNASMIDVIYLHRPHITEKYLDTLASLSPRPRTIYFGHDLHHLRLERQAAVEGSDRLRKEAEEWRRRELRIFAAVDRVYYPSQVEVDYILEECPGLNAKAIPLYIFDELAESDYSAGARGDILFIGGFNHPPNLDGILWFADVFLEYPLPDVKLHIVGSKMPPEVRKLASDRIVTHGFLSDAAVDALYSQVRLSVVPLRFGAGIKGKVLESMAKGVPVLTTEIGAEGVIDAEEGMQIAPLDAFGAMLQTLYHDERRLQTLSAAGRRIIATHYSVAAARDAVVGDFL